MIGFKSMRHDSTLINVVKIFYSIDSKIQREKKESMTSVEQNIQYKLT